MAHSNKYIWRITAAIVAASAIIVLVRNLSQPVVTAPAHLEPVTELSRPQLSLLIDRMRASLRQDPQARGERTRALVETVAALAETKTLENPVTYHALGLALYGKRYEKYQLDKAEEAFRKSIELDPSWAPSHNGLGVVLMAMERWKEAEISLRKSIDLAPNWSRGHGDLAVLLRLQDRLEEAKKEASIAFELDPQNVAANINYGNVLLTMGDITGAEKHYRRGMILEPQEPASYYNLACIAARKEYREGMLAYLNIAIVLEDTFRQYALQDEEFDAYRDDPDFRKLMRIND